MLRTSRWKEEEWGRPEGITNCQTATWQIYLTERLRHVRRLNSERQYRGPWMTSFHKQPLFLRTDILVLSSHKPRCPVSVPLYTHVPAPTIPPWRGMRVSQLPPVLESRNLSHGPPRARCCSCCAVHWQAPSVAIASRAAQLRNRLYAAQFNRLFLSARRTKDEAARGACR